jgi:hypothetical protein
MLGNTLVHTRVSVVVGLGVTMAYMTLHHAEIGLIVSAHPLQLSHLEIDGWMFVFFLCNCVNGRVGYILNQFCSLLYT